MASGGSSGRSPSDPRSFDFGTDDVLCSYDGYKPQDPSNVTRSDRSTREYLESRMTRLPVNAYNVQPDFAKEDFVSVVEECMKKYTDNLIQFLEGISGRLSQLELHCYKLERSIGEFRSDMVRDQGETDVKLKSLEKHLQEVHRSVQIMRDKQELAEAQKELTKLQLEQKIEKAAVSAPSVAEPEKHEGTSNHQLAIVPRQTALPPPQPPSQNQQQDRYLVNQPAGFYAPQQVQVQPPPPPPPQPEMQYVQQRPQDQAPYSQYQPQQWSPPSQPQQFPQQPLQPQQAQAPSRPQTPPVYPSYPIHQSFQGGNMQAPSFGYGNSSGVMQQQQQQPSLQSQSSFGPTPSKGSYNPGAAPFPPPQGYAASMYGVDGIRNTHPQNFHPAGGYKAAQLPSGNSGMGFQHPGQQQQQQQQLVRGNLYGEMIEKAVSMGYSRSQVASVIHMMGETGQPIDLNAVLDRLNQSSPAGGWSG